MESNTSCSVNVTLDLPRSGHSGDGNIVCGGSNEYDVPTCYNVLTRQTINLNEPRSEHTSWSTESGIYLFGGRDQTYNGNPMKSVEFINTSSYSVYSRVSGFQLRDASMYVNLRYLLKDIF